MAVIPEITCRRCGSKYSGLRNRCPKCGAPRMNQPTRVPPTTAAATPQTAANGRAAVKIRWQFIFGAVLLLALILAVIPSEGTEEKYCRELICRSGDGQHWLLYFNAVTGAQERILLLLEDDSGTLAL